MKHFVIALLLGVACCRAVFGQAVDTGEIYRRGDMVEHVDGKVYGASAFAEAIAPPESDADKWFLYLVTSKGCPGCDQLKQAWANSPWLLALGHPDREKSWSHFLEYKLEDDSQNWRFKGIRITRTPTILVQPPRSGKYGDPSTVVFQGYFEGDGKKLAEAITSAIRLYVSKLEPPEPEVRKEPQVSAPEEICPGPLCPTPEPDRTPPWRPKPKDDPELFDIMPRDTPIDFDVRVPPPSVFGGDLSLAALAMIFLAGGVVVIVGQWLYRNWKEKQNRFETLLAELEAVKRKSKE